MPTGTINFYNSWKETIFESANMGSDTFFVLLCTSSYSPNASTHSLLSHITNELSGNGYARQTLSGISSSQSSGNYVFDAGNPEFTASGGPLTARYWVLVNDTLANDPLVCFGLLDGTPADVTVPDGSKIIVNWDAAGIIGAA